MAANRPRIQCISDRGLTSIRPPLGSSSTTTNTTTGPREKLPPQHPLVLLPPQNSDRVRMRSVDRLCGVHVSLQPAVRGAPAADGTYVLSRANRRTRSATRQRWPLPAPCRCDRSGKGASKPPQNSQDGPEIDRWDPGGRRASIGLYLRLRHLPCMESQGIQEARQETAAGHAAGRVLPTAIAPLMKGTPQEIAVRATSLRSGLRCHNSLSFTPDGTPRVEIEDEPHSRPAAGQANNRIATLSSPSSFDD